MIDSHCHLPAAAFEGDRTAVLDRAAAAGVELIVCPATEAASAAAGIELARRGLPVAPAVGVHPGSIGRVDQQEWSRIRALADQPEVVAIGETGLDYFRDRSSGPEQLGWFVRHLALAAELGLPIIVHSREADEDVLRAIEDWRGAHADRIAVLHCFVGGRDLAERALALGCYLGFGGPLTFKSAEACREAARAAPLDRILIETDAPYLAPAPFRGKRNEPAHVRLVADRLAAERGLSVDEVARATAENARRVFLSRVPRPASGRGSAARVRS